MHFFALSWDGFQKSSLKTAEIFENFGPRAEFNTAATVNLPNNGLHHNMRPDACWGAPYGDFVLKYLEIFSNPLAGFEPSETIFAFPYNASTSELEYWLPGVVRAFRTRAIRSIPCHLLKR
jgi:hypothetical protein